MNLITEVKKEELKGLEKTALYDSIVAAVQKYGIRKDVLDLLKKSCADANGIEAYNTNVFLSFVEEKAEPGWISLYLKVSKEKNFSYAAEILIQFKNGADIKKVEEAYAKTKDLFEFHNYMEGGTEEKKTGGEEKIREKESGEETPQDIYSEAVSEIMENSVISDEDIEYEEKNNFHDKLLTMASRACEEYRQKEAKIKDMNKLLKIQNGVIKKQEEKICSCERSMELKDLEIEELRKELDNIRHKYETLSSKVSEVSVLQNNLRMVLE